MATATGGSLSSSEAGIFRIVIRQALSIEDLPTCAVSHLDP